MAIATPTEYGGYDEYEFVNTPPDSCICKICYLPSRDAYMTGSCCRGQTICESCLDHWQKAGNNNCPVCREEEGSFHRNYPIEREVKNLHIYCTNEERGCEWKGALNDISSHLGNSKGCKFERVKCSNECGKIMQRRYLTSHVENECPCRKVNCRYCHDTGEHQFIKGQHKEECPKYPLPCPNKCEVGSVRREDMEAHRKECPLEMIQCEYYGVGCKRARLVRKDQENHNKQNMEDHLMMTTHELIDTKAQLATALQQTANLTAVLMNARLGPNTAASHVNIDIRSVHLESMAAVFKCGDQACPVTIKMTEYSVKKRDEVFWYSDAFYTHNKGYKMHLNVIAAGDVDGKDTHLSVFLFLMKGPHDDELTWPLRGKFEMKLLNQISDSEHHSVTITYDDRTPDDCAGRVTDHTEDNGWGYEQFISNENLYKSTSKRQLLKDDCLYFQVAILAIAT